MKSTISDFQKTVLAYYRKDGRYALPWRTLPAGRQRPDPYAILVSEIMLQQTQVDRVVPYFERWMKKFPTVQMLAEAPLSEVLKEWQGLGYNRRGKQLRECAKEIVEKHGGKVPASLSSLVTLPAIGPYTAGAIRAFAFDEPEIFIETNIRAALIHHFFPRSKNVPDAKLIPILQSIIRKTKSPREWYSALMDYGTFLKKTNPNPSRRSKHHVKQSRFIGSLRQARGAILRTLVSGPASERKLREKTSPTFFTKALEGLASENMIEKKRGLWQIP